MTTQRQDFYSNMHSLLCPCLVIWLRFLSPQSLPSWLIDFLTIFSPQYPWLCLSNMAWTTYTVEHKNLLLPVGIFHAIVSHRGKEARLREGLLGVSRAERWLRIQLLEARAFDRRPVRQPPACQNMVDGLRGTKDLQYARKSTTLNHWLPQPHTHPFTLRRMAEFTL